MAGGSQETIRVCPSELGRASEKLATSARNGQAEHAEDEGGRRRPGTGQGRAAGPRAEPEGGRRHRCETAPTGCTARTNDPVTVTGTAPPPHCPDAALGPRPSAPYLTCCSTDVQTAALSASLE